MDTFRIIWILKKYNKRKPQRNGKLRNGGIHWKFDKRVKAVMNKCQPKNLKK